MPGNLAEVFDSKVQQVLADAREHPLFRLVAAEQTKEEARAEAVRSVLLRVHLYGPSLTGAIFHAIGRIATFDRGAAKVLTDLELDEAEHPELAFRDYLSLGGDPGRRGDVTASPAAFTVAATMDALSRHESPFAFVGALYLLEATTPLIIEALAPGLRAAGGRTRTEFISLHQTQDVEHSATLRGTIDRLAQKDDQTGAAISLGFRVFSIVYPFPVWSECFQEMSR